MTSLISVLCLLGVIGVCYALGKYNKNDNLFWVLLISLLAGMSGGAIFHSATSKKEKNVNFEQVINPTQELPADSISLFAVLGDPSVSDTTPVSQAIETPARDFEDNIAPSESYGEIRGQPNFLNPLNKRTPGMPFDTS